MKLKQVYLLALKESLINSEQINYKGYTILVSEDDGDWTAEISKAGDPEGRMPQFGLSKEVAVVRAKQSIDRMIQGEGFGDTIKKGALGAAMIGGLARWSYCNEIIATKKSEFHHAKRL